MIDQRELAAVGQAASNYRDLSSTPLTDAQVTLFARMNIGLFHNFRTRQTFLSRNYWEACNMGTRMALCALADSAEGRSHA